MLVSERVELGEERTSEEKVWIPDRVRDDGKGRDDNMEWSNESHRR